jgi:hypothetical protein
MERGPKKRRHGTVHAILNLEPIYVPAGSVIKAIPGDYSRKASASLCLTVWTEL